MGRNRRRRGFAPEFLLPKSQGEEIREGVPRGSVHLWHVLPLLSWMSLNEQLLSKMPMPPER